MPQPNPAAFDFLSHRQSQAAKLFSGAVPSPEALRDILTAALRVPDHGKLEPWRLIVLERADMVRLAAMAEARARETGGDAERIDKGRGQFDRGGLAVVVISSPKDHAKVPVTEQVLSAGALCFGVLNAASAAGWGANWLTGWVSHDPTFTARAFGCSGPETVAGIVHIGTPGVEAPDRPRPDLARVVQWGLP
jgi:nitroreductase